VVTLAGKGLNIEVSDKVMCFTHIIGNESFTPIVGSGHVRVAEEI